jgi:hypothetical protein
MVTKATVFAALRQARKVLRRYGYLCHVTADEFVRWLRTDALDPNPTFDEIVENPLFVVHELVEIEAVKRRGLRLTKDVILKNPLPIAAAHLEAVEVEFRIAYETGAYDHLRVRVQQAKAWCEDPVLTPALRKRHQALRDKWVQLLFQSAYDDMVADWMFE